MTGIEVNGKLLVDSNAHTPPTVPSINSVVKANPEAGFSIVNWTGTASAGTVGHGLGASPDLIVVKNYGESADWMVWHSAFGTAGSGDHISLNLTAAKGSPSRNLWNNTLPTSSVFSVGSDGHVNSSGKGIIAYCFSAVPGYSAFGKSTGNLSTDGPFIYTGFTPRFIIWRPTADGHSWMLIDTARDTYNIADATLRAQNANAESHFDWGDVLSNGFKIRNTDTNPSGVDIIWAVWAENPFKTARAR